MNALGVFALVAAGAGLGAVSGAFAVGKGKKKTKQQPYAAIGSVALATGVAAVVWKAPSCPPCNGLAVTPSPSISHGGYAAAVAAASIVGAVAGTLAIGKQTPSKLLGQTPYAPVGGALLGAGLAAALYPSVPTCPPCAAPTPTTSTSTTPTTTTTTPTTTTTTTPTTNNQVVPQ
jgi:hypothetical protein